MRAQRLHWKHMMDADLEPKPRPKISVGDDLADASVEELVERIEALKGEISRCQDAMKAKDAARVAAEAVFGGGASK